MSSLRLDDKLNCIFDKQVQRVTGVEEQKIMLMLWLRTPYNSLPWAPHYGFDTEHCLYLMKLNKREQLRWFLATEIEDAGIKYVEDIKIGVASGEFIVKIIFEAETRPVEFKLTKRGITIE